MGSLGSQLLWLLILAIPVAAVSWTITHEEIFREPRDYCKKLSESKPVLWQRKFFYLFTCEYCFSHYVTAAFLLMTRFKLLYADWRGYVIALFALVWLANIYMAIFANLKLEVHHERLEIKSKDMDLQSSKVDRKAAGGVTKASEQRQAIEKGRLASPYLLCDFPGRRVRTNSTGYMESSRRKKDR